MDDKAVALIEKMAAKLGTTSEYLWTVLTKQALISGITDLLQYGIIAAVVYFAFKYRGRLVEFADEGDGCSIMLFIGVLVLGLLVIIAFFCFPGTVAALVNPEYWALKQVLGAIKVK